MAKQKAALKSKAADIAPAEQGYTVLARRYRPQQFADLVGQEAIARALVNAIESNRVAHAYLFTGTRGVGKTSTARILAKALNCAGGPTPTPCDRCDLCRSIAEGQDVDVLEIDGASNRGIDDIRELRQNVSFRPSRARYKIYIIDEVHQLSKDAFNALLKTLEEPPPHVKFIFATTEANKVPITILSRCQRFDFGGITTARIVERLRQVIVEEGVKAEEEALELVARRAAGSMRDAQSLLDQLLAFGGERLTADMVHQLLGTPHDDRVVALADAVLKRDLRTALEQLARVIDDGQQLGDLVDALLDYWRDLMIVRSVGLEAANGLDLHVSSKHREALKSHAAGRDLDTLLAGLDILAATKARLRGSSHARVLLEMALVRLGRLDDLQPISQLVEALRHPAATGTSGTAAAGTSRPSLSAAMASPPAVEAVKKKFPDAPEPAPASQPTALTAELIAEIWPKVLAQIGIMLSAEVEKAGLPAILGPNTLVLRFTSEYNHQREYCQEPARLTRIEEALRKVSGQPWSLRVEAVAGPQDSGALPEPDAPSPADEVPRSRRQRVDAEKEPLVRRAIELFGAQVVRVDDCFAAAPVSSSERGEELASETEE